MKIQRLLALPLAALLVHALAHAQTEITTDAQQFGYALGFQVGQQIKERLVQEDLDLDNAAFIEAVNDVLRDQEPKLTFEQMQAAYQAGIARRQQAREEMGAKNLEAGRAFLEENKNKDGIVETDSGLQYRVLQPGEGKAPTATDTVVVHYEGRLINGEQFDSSYARGNPATFPVNGIIQGWQEALQLMNVGAVWEVFIPAELGYGAQGAPGGGIGPNEALIFKVELIEVK